MSFPSRQKKKTTKDKTLSTWLKFLLLATTVEQKASDLDREKRRKNDIEYNDERFINGTNFVPTNAPKKTTRSDKKIKKICCFFQKQSTMATNKSKRSNIKERYQNKNMVSHQWWLSVST
jgi:hypothetical protein